MAVVTQVISCRITDKLRNQNRIRLLRLTYCSPTELLDRVAHLRQGGRWVSNNKILLTKLVAIKKGQLLSWPSNLVAGTGFEPVTFGL